MREIKRTARRSLIATAFTLAAMVGLPAFGQEPPSDVDPKAQQLLRQMSDYMADLQQFTVRTENTLEVVLTSMQKLQYGNPAQMTVKRPDKFHANRKGDLVDQEFFYNGETLTLYSPGHQVYATVAAPPTMEEALDFARESLDIIAPATDFLYKNSYDVLMADVISGFYVGTSIVGGVKCHHLAFQGYEVDWQVWIEDGDQPLPKKVVMTTKRLTGAPQFTVTVTDWDLAPKIEDGMFNFTPPKTAHQVDFYRLTDGGESRAD